MPDSNPGTDLSNGVHSSMPHLTFGISPDGFALTVLVGRNGKDSTDMVNAGQVVPSLVAVRGVMDSGSDVTCIASGRPIVA
jgi:hypothetical protein